MTDKASNGLLPEYERIFAPFKEKNIKVLEVGVYRGGFLKWLKKNLPLAEIVGMDISPPVVEGIKIYATNQNDTDGLKKIGEESGPFDFIIDDGSHAAKETGNTFLALWEYLKPSGHYIIEDWIIGYWAVQSPTYAHGEGMVELITDLMKSKDKLGISDMEILLKEPRCSMATFHKKI